MLEIRREFKAVNVLRKDNITKRALETEEVHIGCDVPKFKDIPIHGYKATPGISARGSPMTAQASMRDALIGLGKDGIRIVWGEEGEDTVFEYGLDELPQESVPAPCGHDNHWIIKYL